MKQKAKYNTDDAMKSLFHHMLRDFRTVMGQDYHRDAEIALAQSITAFRTMSWPDRLQAPPHVFKKEVQLENLFKRYTFKRDMYSPKELSDRTFDKFMDNQKHLVNHEMRPVTLRAFRVVQKARSILRELLDGIDPLDAEAFSRFSTKATVGNPARDAYIDHKLADPISGSPEHIRWFKSHLRGHGYLASLLAQLSPTGDACFEVCESLPLVDVPKSWKSKRLISPNTLIGSYYTYGLGKLLVKAMKKARLFIAKLQSRHQELARESSITRKLVTADLSSASESFLWSLICRLLPRKWVRALNRGRIRSYTRKGKTYYYHSFMAMGIGFTFPLQTLLFYAIVKACCELSNVSGLVSVYGDDLIYPRKCHSVVSQILTDLGMKLNMDKTFSSSYFRESCGGDFYHGIDVRPFNPEGAYRQLTSKRYTAWLYQMVNGLRLRWSDEEIPHTLAFLASEINRVGAQIYRVPMSYPDYSGWRTLSPTSDVPGICAPILLDLHQGSRRFLLTHLSQTSKLRYVSFQEAYLYEWLRSRDVPDDPEQPDTNEAGFIRWLRTHCYTRRADQSLSKWLNAAQPLNGVLKSWFNETTPVIQWVRAPKQPKKYLSITRRRLRKTVAATPCNVSLPILTNETGSISDWI